MLDDTPKTSVHRGITVVRDDLFEGGTKARYIGHLFEDTQEVVYASPAQGGAQTALAMVARQVGKRATIFVAKRKQPHARALLAKSLGASVYQVTPGHLNVVQARARQYAEDKGAKLASFGFAVPQSTAAISAAARSLGLSPPQVWCAAGSGTLARGLMDAWPNAEFHLVQVGRDLDPLPIQAMMHLYPKAFDDAVPCGDFPSDPHYDAKAWEICHQSNPPEGAVFWNVTGPA